MAGLDDISVANYTRISYETTPGSGTYTDIAEVQSIGELTDEKTIIDVQEYGVQYMRKLVGSANAGPLELIINLNPAETTHQYLFTAYKNDTRVKFQLRMTNAANDKGDSVTFTALVASKSFGNEFDTARTASVSLAIDGAISDLTADV